MSDPAHSRSVPSVTLVVAIAANFCHDFTVPCCAVLGLVLCVAGGSVAAQDVTLGATIYLFSTFKEPEQDGLRFSYSFDGYHWINMPGVFLKTKVGSGILRDPSVLLGLGEGESYPVSRED